VALSIAPDYLAVVRNAAHEIVLGIILPDDSVRLKLASRACPGHVEWLAEAPAVSVARGFSLLVKNGQVDAIFPRSRLNRQPDARLEQPYVNELICILPCNKALRVLE